MFFTTITVDHNYCHVIITIAKIQFTAKIFHCAIPKEARFLLFKTILVTTVFVKKYTICCILGPWNFAKMVFVYF